MASFTRPLLLACFFTFGAAAQDVRERSDLGLVERQFALIEQLASHARNESVDATEARYRFDYLGFAADLERVRQGVHKYLSPSRAQPADLLELTGDYRTEAPHLSPSNDHD